MLRSGDEWCGRWEWKIFGVVKTLSWMGFCRLLGFLFALRFQDTGFYAEVFNANSEESVEDVALLLTLRFTAPGGVSTSTGAPAEQLAGGRAGREGLAKQMFWSFFYFFIFYIFFFRFFQVNEVRRSGKQSKQNYFLA